MTHERFSEIKEAAKTAKITNDTAPLIIAVYELVDYINSLNLKTETHETTPAHPCYYRIRSLQQRSED
jgi:hypothetical protein